MSRLEEQFEDAIRECAAARTRFEAAKPGTPAWRSAAADLDWWIGRKAFIASAVKAAAVTA